MDGRSFRTGGVRRRIGRLAAISGVAVALLACGPQSNPQTFLNSLGPNPDTAADAAFAAMVRGDFGKAEKEVETALKSDPKNPYALLAAGILYQNTNRPVKAREMYEELLALRPNKMATVGGWDLQRVAPISEIAAANMRNVDAALGRSGSWQMTSAYAPTAAVPAPQGAAAATLSPVVPPSAVPVAAPRGAVQAVPMAGAAGTPVAAMDARTQAIADRFLVMQKLRDEQLISPEEYRVRRVANAGALLPLTEPPPAKGLDRPVPALEQLVDRLRALQQALQTRAITPREHAMERELILDALLPAKPESLAAPEPAPRDLIASAERVRQLERLRNLGLISEAEMKAEQAAVEKALRTTSSGVLGDAGAPGMLIPADAASRAPLPGQMTVHLASYRSLAQAQAGWADIRKRFSPQLATLASDIRKATVPGKGDFYRLYAGPIGSRAEADRICRDLRKKKQFCEITSE
jgi:tetratricopeptide (TPR) repeat protein